MIKNIFNFLKDYKVEIFRFKIILLVIINIVFIYWITVEMLDPLKLNKYEIKGLWLETLMKGILGNNMLNLGIQLNSLKMMFLLGIFIILNITVLYFSVIMFAGLILYMMKTCNKIYTNFLINKENLYVLGLKFEHIITEAQKKDILDSIYTNKIKNNDPVLYDDLYNEVMKLSDKNEIYEMVLNKINEYIIKEEKKVFELEKLNKIEQNDYIQGVLDSIWSHMTIKNVIILAGVIGVGIACVYFYNSVTGASTTKLIGDVANKGADQMQNSVNTTENVMVELQNQQAKLVENQRVLQELINTKTHELQLQNLEILKNLNNTTKTISEYMVTNNLRHENTLSQINNNIDKVTGAVGEVSSTVLFIRGTVSHVLTVLEILTRDEDSRSIGEVEE